MVHKIAKWLEQCPHIDHICVGTLEPGTGTGLFPKGIDRVRRDILGNCRVTATLLLRHRGRPEEDWPSLLSGWVLEAQPPAGYTVTPRGGRLCAPTRDGWGTWEMELIIEN